MSSTALEAAPEVPLTAEEAFDSIGTAYEDAFAGLLEQASSVEWLLTQLKDAGIETARFVDMGCGTGRPVCLILANAGHDVLGIDISTVMVAAARERVPNAKFKQMDIRDFNPPQGSYDAASVYFSLIAGVTQDEIRTHLAKIYHFLQPGGFFVFATIAEDADKIQLKWMGRLVTVSSLDVDGAVLAVERVGFEIVYKSITTFMPRGAEAGICGESEVWEEPHLFIYARKPGKSKLICHC
jgi:SAM-dependent methyltransferase